MTCNHLHVKENSRAVLSRGSVYYAVQGGSFFESVYETLLCDHSDTWCLACIQMGARSLRFALLVFPSSSPWTACDAGAAHAIRIKAFERLFFYKSNFKTWCCLSCRGRWFSLWPFKWKLCKSTLTSWIITSIYPRFLTIQTKTIKNTINFSYIFPKNSNHEEVNELKFWPVSCHGYRAWYAINEVCVLEVRVFGIWERSSSIEPENFNC